MSLQMKGFTQTLATLRTLQKKTAKAAMRKAVRAGTTIIKAAVKADMTVDKGLLKKAEDMRLVTNGMRFIGVAGANKAKLEAAHTIDGRPTNIDWLVNFGHVAPNGRFVPPSAHTYEAGDAAQPAAQARMEQVLTETIESLATS